MSLFKINFFRKILLLATIILVALYAGINFAGNKIITPKFLSDFAKEKYGLELKTSSITTHFNFFSYGIYLEDLSVKDPHENEVLFSAEHPNIKISIFPLLLKKLSIDEIGGSSLLINLTRYEDGSFNFSKYIKNEKSMFKPDFTRLKTGFGNYTVNINDLISKNNFSIKGNTFFLKGFDLKRGIILHTNGIITMPDEKTAPYLANINFSKVDGKIKLKQQEILLSQVDLSFLQSYFKKLGFTNFEGKIDIFSDTKDKDFFNLSFYTEKINIAFNYKNEKNTIISNKPFVGDFNFNFADKDLNIKNLSILGDNVNFDIKGMIYNAFDIKNIEPKITFTVKNTHAQNLAALLPDTVLPLQEDYIKNIKFYNVNGIIDGAIDIDYKNKKDYTVNGKFDFNDVYIINRPKNSQTAFGECNFKGKDVSINVWVNTPNNGMVTVFGKTKIWKNPPAQFEINSYGNIDMNYAQSILKPLQTVLGLKLGPLPYMDLDGYGKIHLLTNGNKEHAKLTGYFETDNATVSMEGIAATLKNGKVKIIFDNDNIVYNGAKGTVEGANIQIDGNATTFGDMNLSAKVSNIEAKKAIKIAENSFFVTSALDGGGFLKTFRPTKGNVDFSLNLNGNIPPDSVFGEPSENVKAKGEILFKGVDITIDPNIEGKNTKGILTFENNAEFDLTTNIFNSPFKIKGSVGQKTKSNKIIHGVPSDIDITFNSNDVSSSSIGNFVKKNLILFTPDNRLFANTLADIFLTNKFKVKGNIQAKGQVYSNSKTLDLSGFDFKGKIYGINNQASDAEFKKGWIELNNKTLEFHYLDMVLSKVGLLINGKIDKFASQKPHNNLKITFKNSNAAAYFNILEKTLKRKSHELAKNIKNIQGELSGSVQLTGDKVSGNFSPKNLSAVINGGKTSLESGKIQIKDDKLYLDALTFMYEEIPVLIDGFIETKGSINPEFNLYLSTNLTEEYCDRLVNPILKYPLSIEGEATVKGRISGTTNSYQTYLTIGLNEGSDLSFMGLKIGDIDTKREISSKIKFSGNWANISHVKYSKYVLSQNNKPNLYDIIKLYGDVKLSQNNIEFYNLRVLTPKTAPVRFLNPVFKKSVLKDGSFSSDIILNGTPDNLLVTGDIDFSNVLAPSLHSKIDKVKVKLNKDTGNANGSFSTFRTKGDFNVNFINKSKFPFIINNIYIHSNEADITQLTKDINAYAQTPSNTSNNKQGYTLSPTDIKIQKGNILIDKILINGIEGNNLKINFSHSKNGILLINGTYLSIADGLIKGVGEYNFTNKDISANLDFINCNADTLSKAFLNLSGQIYGSANGKVALTLKDYGANNYLNKINAGVEFEIKDGKMPKLGSIEYLLRASNLIKSGLFGFTLNNLIEVLTPYKGGEFDKITGNFKVENAKVQDLKIYSQGKNLSTYIYGTYDIESGILAIEVLGKLSKKISNLLGAIGNTSVISALNAITRNKMESFYKSEIMQNISKVPFIDFNDDEYRIFNAKLNGKANEEGIVKSFNWLN